MDQSRNQLLEPALPEFFLNLGINQLTKISHKLIRSSISLTTINFNNLKNRLTLPQ